MIIVFLKGKLKSTVYYTVHILYTSIDIVHNYIDNAKMRNFFGYPVFK